MLSCANKNNYYKDVKFVLKICQICQCNYCEVHYKLYKRPWQD